MRREGIAERDARRGRLAAGVLADPVKPTQDKTGMHGCGPYNR